jgi:hypothetical protein
LAVEHERQCWRLRKSVITHFFIFLIISILEREESKIVKFLLS